jgi:hypothetical protein
MIENLGTIKVGCVRGVEELRRSRFRGFEDCGFKLVEPACKKEGRLMIL